MLNGIDPLITPDLIKVLMEMGHDDAVLLADANFTAMSLGAGKPVLRLPGTRMAQVVRAIMPLLPLASDTEHPVAFMQVSGKPPPYLSGLQREILALMQGSMLAHQQAEPVERYAFYDRVRSAYAIVVTGELQPFGNFILRKGTLGEALCP